MGITTTSEQERTMYSVNHHRCKKRNEKQTSLLAFIPASASGGPLRRLVKPLVRMGYPHLLMSGVSMVRIVVREWVLDLEVF